MSNPLFDRVCEIASDACNDQGISEDGLLLRKTVHALHLALRPAVENEDVTPMMVSIESLILTVLLLFEDSERDEIAAKITRHALEKARVAAVLFEAAEEEWNASCEHGSHTIN